MKYLLIFLLLLPTTSVLAREVSFSWEPMEGALEYELQISNNEDFSKPLVEQKLLTPEFSSNLDSGRYFYRVRVIDQSNHPGKWSNIAPVIVAAIAPEMIKPPSGYETSYYEKIPDIDFAWKQVDLTSAYEIIIKDKFGQEVVHTTQDKATYTGNLSAGEYQWQVRSLGRSPIPGQPISTGDVPSDFSKPWIFKVIKNNLDKPVLKTPLNGEKLTNHESIDFSWTQDPHTHFADLKIEALDGEKPETLKFEKIKETDFKKIIERPGHYRWSITSKETADTPGVASETRDFTVIDDPLFAGNYELELNTSYGSDVYQTSSSLQTLSPNQISQQSTSSGMHYGLSAGYYVFRGLGFFVSARQAPLAVENITITQQELDGQIRFRYGANGFFQEFWFGYRQMDVVEAENTPTSEAFDMVTTGPLVGSRVSADVSSRVKIQATGYYYRPINFSSSQIPVLGPVNADIMGGSLGFKWNFENHFWFGYRFAIERENVQVVRPLSPPYINSSWSMNRLEPIYLSISYER